MRSRSDRRERSLARAKPRRSRRRLGVPHLDERLREHDLGRPESHRVEIVRALAG
jgi:hypothetical protein